MSINTQLHICVAHMWDNHHNRFTSRTKTKLLCNVSKEVKDLTLLQSRLTFTSQELSLLQPQDQHGLSVWLQRHTPPCCAGDTVPRQRFMTLSENWIILVCVCLCVREGERKQCVQKKHWRYLTETQRSDKGVCLCLAPTAPSPSLYQSPSLHFSLGDADSVEQSERRWFSSLLYLKTNPLSDQTFLK